MARAWTTAPNPILRAMSAKAPAVTAIRTMVSGWIRLGLFRSRPQPGSAWDLLITGFASPRRVSATSVLPGGAGGSAQGGLLACGTSDHVRSMCGIVEIDPGEELTDQSEGGELQ